MTPLRAQAEQLAAKANECCNRSDGYEEELCDLIEAFATRVQEEEREECAKVIDDYDDRLGAEADKFNVDEKASTENNMFWRVDGAADACVELAAAIRQRGGQG